VLLDRQCALAVEACVRGTIEAHPHDRVTDLHLWSIGPGPLAAEIALCSTEPKQPEHYKQLLPADLGLVHVMVEVQRHAASRSA
jgi:Co/Zn/Cd efflux system component